MITNEFFQSECKGLEVYNSLCQNNFVALSNNFYMVRPSNSDRRYAHIQCSKKKDFIYYMTLAKAFNNQTASYFFNFWARINISKWNKRIIPSTSYIQKL